jgi:hypothetical protein
VEAQAAAAVRADAACGSAWPRTTATWLAAACLAAAGQKAHPLPLHSGHEEQGTGLRSGFARTYTTRQQKPKTGRKRPAEQRARRAQARHPPRQTHTQRRPTAYKTTSLVASPARASRTRVHTRCKQPATRSTQQARADWSPRLACRRAGMSGLRGPLQEKGGAPTPAAAAYRRFNTRWRDREVMRCGAHLVLLLLACRIRSLVGRRLLNHRPTPSRVTATQEAASSTSKAGRTPRPRPGSTRQQEHAATAPAHHGSLAPVLAPAAAL